MKVEGREGRDSDTKAEGREGRQERNSNMNAETRSGIDAKSQTTTGQAGARAKLSTEQRTKITTVIRDQHTSHLRRTSTSRPFHWVTATRSRSAIS